MFEYIYGDKVSEEKKQYYKGVLVKEFGTEYDIKTNRLWNCLKKECECMEFASALNYEYPPSVILYLERQDEVYNTTITDVCRYVNELEPWEYIDAYVFDETYAWLLAITHEELKCLVVGFSN